MDSYEDPHPEDDEPDEYDYHSVTGDCPFGHHHYEDDGTQIRPPSADSRESLNDCCTCHCEHCPRMQYQERKSGNHDGPRRRHFRPPGRGELPSRRRPGQEQIFPNDPTFAELAARIEDPVFPQELRSYISRLSGGFDNGKENYDTFPRKPWRHNLMTFALGRRPCTEMIPWNVRRRTWTHPCPNDRRDIEERGPTKRPTVWGCVQCNARGTPFDSNGDPRRRLNSPWHDRMNPPGLPFLGGNVARWAVGSTERWVCEDHREDSKLFWEEDSLHKAHRVGTCEGCRIEFTRLYPEGRNTCTCKNWLAPWLCRSCYEGRVRYLQNEFRRRVDQSFRRIIKKNPQDYHRDWRGLSAYLAEGHPCGRNHPANTANRRLERVFRHRRPRYTLGAQRLLENEQVMDCRACGGIIVEPTLLVTTSQERRRMKRLGRMEPLMELDFSKGNRGGRARQINPDVPESLVDDNDPFADPDDSDYSDYAASTTSYKQGPSDANGNPTTSHALRPTRTTGPKTGDEGAFDVDWD